MAKRTSGRKKAFDPEMEPERLHIILPRKTKIALEVYAARYELNRNQVIHDAIMKYVDEGGEENPQ